MCSVTLPFQDDGDLPNQDSNQSSWKRLLPVGLIFALGLICFAWSPLWLTPPHFTQTTMIYVILLVVWVPFLVLLGRHSMYFVGLLLLGLLLNLVWMMVFSHRALTIQWLFPLTINCAEESDNSDQVRYTCIREGSDAYTEHRFTGREGLPIMWRNAIRFRSDTPDQ